MFLIASLLSLSGCFNGPAAVVTAEPAAAADGKTRELTIGAYTTPREAFDGAILPGFAEAWRLKTGQTVTFKESYQGSGAQARAIVEGFEADVVALSLDPDIATLEKAGLIHHDWRGGPDGGIVSRSVVVIAVRPGNPKGIHDWSDLTKPGVQVVTPNVRTSGGAMWNVSAIWGAAIRGKAGTAATAAGATSLLSGVLKNVSVMDKGARESMITFENGVGDAALTYENEVIVAKAGGKQMDYVIPKSTILIENPAAVVDTYADEHGNRDIAEAFVSYLHSPEAQKAYAKYGLRGPDAKAAANGLPAVPDLFTVRDIGGWTDVKAKVFDKGAGYDQALAAAQK